MRLGQQLGSYGPGSQGNPLATTLALPKVERGGRNVELRFTPCRQAPVTSDFGASRSAFGTPYRNPALLAKMLTTLDVVAHGHTIIGLGAAWHDEEFLAYGWLCRTLNAERGTRNREESFRVPRSTFPLRAALRIVAQYADFCNVGGDPAEGGTRKWERGIPCRPSGVIAANFRLPRSAFRLRQGSGTGKENRGAGHSAPTTKRPTSWGRSFKGRYVGGQGLPGRPGTPAAGPLQVDGGAACVSAHDQLPGALRRSATEAEGAQQIHNS